MEVRILPVAEAVRNFCLMEYVLDFYEEGLRGLICDHILLSNAYVCDNDDVDSIFEADPLQLKIVTMYENSARYQNDVRMGKAEQRLSEALNSSMHVRKWVNNMMYQIFRNDVYTVNAQQWRWLGNDLVVRMDIWN